MRTKIAENNEIIAIENEFLDNITVDIHDNQLMLE